jgi:6-phosphogluconolactonase (cycloisomerase 2 family)
VRKAILAAAVLVSLAPASASAVAPGGLQQLPAPNDCVSTSAASNCGTIVNGGLGAAHSVAVPPDGTSAYAASTTGALTTFGRNASTGALSFTTCVKDPSSTEACPSNSNRPLGGAAWVVATNANVYVAAADGDAVTVFTRNPSTGALTSFGCISQSGGNSAGGPACQTSAGLSGVERLAISADGKSLYAVSSSNSTLATLVINQSNGGLTAGGCVRGTASTDVSCGSTPAPGLNGVNDVATSPDDTSVYATATTGGSVSYLTGYTRNTTSGALTQSQCFHSSGAQSAADTAAPPCSSNPTPVFGLNGADGAIVSPDNANVYVASGASGPAMGNSLVTFNRNTGNGNLSGQRCFRDPASTVENCGAGTTADRPGLKGAFDLAMNPAGTFLYVTASTGNDVAEFSRNAGSNGDLTQLPGADKCIGRQGNNTDCTGNNSAKGLLGASGIHVTSDGLFAYVAAPGDSAVSEFRIEAPPTCANVGPINTPQDQPVTFVLPCSDPNPGEAVTCTVVTQPTNGTVTQSSPGSCTVTFTPNLSATGADSFTYKATDTVGQDSNTATASVTVLSSSAPSVSIADAAANESAGTMTFQLTMSKPVGTPVVVNYSTVSGSAVSPADFTAQTSTATFTANQTTTTVVIPIVNDSIHEGNESFSINLSNNTAGIAIARPTAAGTIADDDTTAISVGDVTVSESDGTASFVVSLSNPSSGTVDATYATANGSAVAPGDFTAQSAKIVSFAPGETSKPVTVPLVDDTTPEQTEQFLLNLSSPTGGSSLGKSQGVGTIQDDDSPNMTVSDAAVAEGNSGSRNATFTVALSTPISRTVTVNFATADGSATTADSDYNSGTGVLTFAAGETSKTIDVAVTGDTKAEGDETFTLGLSGATNAAVTDGSGAGTILDDDTVATQPGLFVSDTTITEGDSGTRAATFTVSLTAAAASEVKVDFATADGTAKAATDYNSGTGVLTFAAGETSKTVTVQVKGDTTFEPDETFTVNLSNSSGAPISKGTGTGTIGNDDVKRLKPRIALSVTPARDRRAPFRYTASGTVRRPAGVGAANACTGIVRVQYRSGGRTIASGSTAVLANCRFRLVTSFSNARRIRGGRLTVAARFAGNRFLLPARSASRSVRAR